MTPAEHQIFTNKWRQHFPYGVHDYELIPNARIWIAAQDVYKDFPAILRAVQVALGF